MTLTKETGTADPLSNSYATVAEADDYFTRHTSGTAWAAKSTEDKETLLIMAARTLDYGAQWQGIRVSLNQGMQWPRVGVVVECQAWPEDEIPRQIREAQYELAALIMTGGDRNADQDSDGIKSLSLGKGAIAVEFDAATSKAMLGRAAPQLIAMFAISTGGGRGMVRVRRM